MARLGRTAASLERRACCSPLGGAAGSEAPVTAAPQLQPAAPLHLLWARSSGSGFLLRSRSAVPTFLTPGSCRCCLCLKPSVDFTELGLCAEERWAGGNVPDKHETTCSDFFFSLSIMKKFLFQHLEPGRH